MSDRPSTFVLIHGGGDSASSWQLVADELHDRDQQVVAVDLPIEDPDATLDDLAAVVADAARGAGGLVVVAHSWGAFVAPLVCQLLPVELMVLVAAVVPTPGEAPTDFWSATGHAEASAHDLGDEDTFFHDLPPDAVALGRRGGRTQTPGSGRAPWPVRAWPAVPTRFLLCREDRVLPAPWLRALVRDRLGIVPEEMAGGHCPMLGRPVELTERLLAYRAEQSAPTRQ